MRNLLALFAAAVLTFIGVGWYLGWYHIQASAAADGHQAYNVDLNARKIREDLHRGTEKLQEAIDSSRKDDGKRAVTASPANDKDDTN